MLSVGIICAYFGELPGCFSCWLKSCEFNPTINFLLITDQEVNTVPKNVRVIKLSFQFVQKLADNKIGCHVALDYPYKLCDLKPMYGIMFCDYLDKYDYWGHCDMDMVFGDIRGFLERYNFEKYEKFLDLGHLSLYKNTIENNNRFRMGGSQCGTWKEVISDPEGHAFDELNGIYQIYLKNNIPVFDKRIYADISMLYTRFRCALDDPNYDQQVFYWENGHIFRSYWIDGKHNIEEFIYIHFKKRNFGKQEFDVKTVNSFYIGPSGYTKKITDATLEDVYKINPFYGEKIEKKELSRKMKHMKIKNWKKRFKRLLNII